MRPSTRRGEGPIVLRADYKRRFTSSRDNWDEALKE